jgi:hypothetical protein
MLLAGVFKKRPSTHAGKRFSDYFSTSDLELSNGELEGWPELNNIS